MEGFCRGCLIKYDDSMELLQYTEKNRRLFVYATGLQVKRNDTFTFQLCKDCFLNMKLACKFKKLCRTSDKRFKNYMALKDVGDPVDFCTFLKNHDDTLTFRLPLTSGNSTPTHQKRDDDNESTCTSIRNFMTDLMQGQEVPDTEARIIREVIEEEADVLDDSLDSHWLQDDLSIDTDFRLDGFSPFSTPRSTRSIDNDNCYTPKRYAEFYNPTNEKQNEKDDPIDFYNSTSEKQNDLVSGLDLHVFKEEIEKDTNEPQNDIESSLNVEACKNVEDIDSTNEKQDDIVTNLNAFKQEKEDEEVIDEQVNFYTSTSEKQTDISNDFNVHASKDKDLTDYDIPSLGDTSLDKVNINTINAQNFYVPQDDIVSVDEHGKEIIKHKIIIQIVEEQRNCTIDRNLEKALNNKENKDYSLADLLNTPTAASGASTPTIKNILFGEKLDIIHTSIKPKLGQCIEPFEDVQGDIEVFEEFFHNDTREFDAEDIKKFNDDIDIDDSKETISLDNIDIEESRMMIAIASDDVPINESSKKDKEVMAQNKAKLTDQITSMIKKIDTSNDLENDQFDLSNCFCKICKKKFNTSRALSIHFTKCHKIKIITPKRVRKRMCSFCGREFRTNHFYKHVKTCKTKNVEEKDPKEIFTYKCEICEISCSSQAKLDLHKRAHNVTFVRKNTKTKPIVCTICGITLSKAGNYKLHMRRHTKSYRMSCEECGKGFYRQSDYAAHLRVHTGDRPYKCSHCTLAFRRRDLLTRHYQSSHAQKRFECDYCGRKCAFKFELKNHIMRCIKIQEKRNRPTTKPPEIVIKTTTAITSEKNKETTMKLAETVTKTEVNDNTVEKVIVNVMYTTGDEKSIKSQAEKLISNLDLPHLETDLSN